ncbi:MAG: methylated-DNA--[protein]-cysteine S-methyltransferase [Planctomycetota bacterium]
MSSNCGKLCWGSVDTRFGRVFAAASSDGIVAVTLPREAPTTFHKRLKEQAKKFARGLEICEQPSTILNAALSQIVQYFEGTRREFKIPIDLRATPFTKKVLLNLTNIRFGDYKTYGELAKAIGSPRASRAVGLALSKNPIPIILPCHRIVASNGIGGFAGKTRQIDLKREMLRLEGIDI